jgi:hypothetical protein
MQYIAKELIMSTGYRTSLAIAAAIGAVLSIYGFPQAAAQSGSTKASITFEGGYAWVFPGSGERAEVGAVSGDPNHTLRLAVCEGSVSASGAAPQPAAPKEYQPFQDWRITVKKGDSVPLSSTGWRHGLNLTAEHALRAGDSEDVFSAFLQLNSGAAVVKAGGADHEIKRDNKPFETRTLASHVRWDDTYSAAMTLYFVGLRGNEGKFGAWTIQPASNVVRLLAAPKPLTVKPRRKEALTHFDAIYGAFGNANPAAKQHLLPHYPDHDYDDKDLTCDSPRGRTPGDACPLARFTR